MLSSLSILMLAFLAGPAQGAEPHGKLTLSEAIETAGENNPDLQKKELAANSSSWGRLEALSEHLPHISANGLYLTNAKYGSLGVDLGTGPLQFPSAFPQADFHFEASLLLFDGFGAWNRYRAALFNNEAAQLELSRARFETRKKIEKNFYDALAAEEFVKVADENIQTLTQHLNLAQASQRAGFSTKVDVLRIESLMEEAKAEKILATDKVAIAKDALVEAMGEEKDDRPLEGELPVPDPNKVPQNLALDPSKRDDLQALARREKAQDRLNAAANSHWYPKVSVFANEQFYEYGNFDPHILASVNFQNSYSVGFRASWDLFDGGGSIAKKAQADDTARIAEETTRALSLSSPNELARWKRMYTYNTALYEARKRSVEKSTESVRLATLAVKAGTKTHSEALDAELELFHARAGLVEAQVGALDALADLELALGHAL